jgi:hypothetical protein
MEDSAYLRAPKPLPPSYRQNLDVPLSWDTVDLALFGVLMFVAGVLLACVLFPR